MPNRALRVSLRHRSLRASRARYYHKLISICSIDQAFAAEGTEVQVVWGDCGQRQINICAKVARFPYLDLPANQNYDMDSIPRFDV